MSVNRGRSKSNSIWRVSGASKSWSKSHVDTGSPTLKSSTTILVALHVAPWNGPVSITSSPLCVPDRSARCYVSMLRDSHAMAVIGVRRAKAALSSACKPHPATAPAGSNRSSRGGDEVTEAD
jgi:hypothetical protein